MISLSECYGSYASSAIAGQSLTRNIFGGAFSLFTEQVRCDACLRTY